MNSEEFLIVFSYSSDLVFVTLEILALPNLLLHFLQKCLMKILISILKLNTVLLL